MTRFYKTHQSSNEGPQLKVSVFWGDVLFDTAICKPDRPITIGRARENTFILDLADAGSRNRFKLVEVNADHSANLYFDEGLTGHLRFGKELLSLDTAKARKQVIQEGGLYRARLSKEDKADVVVGHVSFYLDWVSGEKRSVVPRSQFLDRKQKWALLGLLAFVGAVIGLSQYLPVPEVEKPPERLVTLIPRNVPAKAAMGSEKSGDGGAQSGALGKADTQQETKPTAAQQLQKANLGSLLSGLTSISGGVPVAKSNPSTHTGALVQSGTHGFSSEGMKTGGGGKSMGIGRTVGQGEGGFEGTGRLGLSGNSAIEGGTGHGTAEVVEQGGLDRGVIDAIIRRRQDRIRLCYERQLNFNPKLAGKIAVRFLIGKEGTVVDGKILEDTMKNANVNACILSEVKSWTFPRPKGGTQVNVDYPFVFESSARGSS